jgi:hypothetical protein
LRHYFDSDLFGDDGLMQNRANPFGYLQRQQRPRASQPMRQPKPVPGPTSYGGINQRAMQEADAPSGYFDPQPTDSDIMGGEIDPEIAGGLEAANSDYFAPRSQVSADDQIMGGSIDPTTARMAEDPYFGKPYNEDKDPPGHQQVAAAPEELKQATSAYADRIRKLRADRDAAVEASGVGKKASVWNRIWKGDAGVENERSLKIANAEAVFQGGVNAANQELAAVHPEYFGKRTPEKHYWERQPDGSLLDRETGEVQRGVLPPDAPDPAKAPKPIVAGGRYVTVGPDGAATTVTEKRTIPAQGPAPFGRPGPTAEVDVPVEAPPDRGDVVAAQEAGRDLRTDKRLAGERADRAASDASKERQHLLDEVDRIRREKRKAGAEWKASPLTSKEPFDSSDYDADIAALESKLKATPTTSVAPPTDGGSGSPGPLAKVDKPMAGGGGGAAYDPKVHTVDLGVGTSKSLKKRVHAYKNPETGEIAYVPVS